MLRAGFIFVLFFAMPSYFAQKCDTTAVKLLCRQSKEILAADLDKSYGLALEAYSKARKCEGTNAYYESVIALATVYYQKDYNDSISILVVPVLKQMPPGTLPRYVAALNHKLSIGYVNLMKLEQGLKHDLVALTNYELCKDTANTANVLVNIANVYQQQNNFTQADKYLREAEKKAGLLSRKTVLGNVYNTMGILYAEHSQLDSAEKFFLLSTTIREGLGDKTTVSWNYNNLGGLYYMQGKFEKAAQYMEKAFRAFSETENFEGLSDVANNLGELYLEQKEYKKAFYYFNYSRNLYSRTNNKDNLENLYINLSAYYKKTGDLKTALDYSDSLVVLKDSLYGNRLDRSIAEMQVKYESEKKDLALAKNKAELETRKEQAFIKNVIIVAVICLFVLGCITAYLFYRKKQLQQKAELDAEHAKQKELRSKAVMEAEEKERIRIATDLHDGVGQLLSAAKLNLSSLESKVKIETPEQELAFKNALSLVDDSVKEVRVVSHNMMPNTLLKLGLASAVKEFVTRIQGTPNLKVNLEIVGLNERLGQEKETVLYRVIQEVVSNIIKHAKASELTLQMIHHGKELSVVIEDNGVGFDTSKMNDFEGIGLKNIRSRIEFINGSVHFDSVLNRGTTVIIDIAV